MQEDRIGVMPMRLVSGSHIPYFHLRTYLPRNLFDRKPGVNSVPSSIQRVMCVISLPNSAVKCHSLGIEACFYIAPLANPLETDFRRYIE